MSRTKKWTVHEAASEAKWFTHNGHSNTDPTKVKKLGAGSYNWGQPGDELQDDKDLDSTAMFGRSERRNSNHSQHELSLRMLNDQLDSSLFAESV